jgi:tRNA(fMet)-specific endonuclease VapC
MKKVLLDTSGYSKLLAGDERILECLAHSGVVYLSVFVLGELHAGFKGGSRERENCRQLQEFLTRPPVRIVNATDSTAEVFGEIKARLRQKGTPLPINDVWIAAHALETGATLISFDRHFKIIPGVRLWEPLLEP